MYLYGGVSPQRPWCTATGGGEAGDLELKLVGQALALGMRTSSSAARNKWRSLLSRLLRRVRTSLAAALARRREGPSLRGSPRRSRSEEGDDEEELEDHAGSIPPVFMLEECRMGGAFFSCSCSYEADAGACGHTRTHAHTPARARAHRDARRDTVELAHGHHPSPCLRTRACLQARACLQLPEKVYLCMHAHVCSCASAHEGLTTERTALQRLGMRISKAKPLLPCLG